MEDAQLDAEAFFYLSHNISEYIIQPTVPCEGKVMYKMCAGTDAVKMCGQAQAAGRSHAALAIPPSPYCRERQEK